MKGANKVQQLGLAADLRNLRARSGLSTRAVAAKLGVSRMAVNRTEHGTRRPTLEEVVAMCALYGVTGRQRDRLIERARGGDGSSSWLATGPAIAEQLRSLVALEGEASGITSVSVTYVPGLVQTPEYMRAVVANSPEREWMVATRLARQALVTKPDAPRLRLIIDEAVLHRPVGGTRVMLSQLEHLLRMATKENVSLEVIPTPVGMHPGLDGSFMLLTFPEREPHVYVEVTGSSLILTRSGEVQPFVDSVRQLDQQVLSEERSTELIKHIMEGLCDE